VSVTWLEKAVVLAIHDRQIAEHGGILGVRDMGLLESALERPRQLVAYEEEPDDYDLAAAYAHGIARNHPFLDGNTRTAYVTCMTFLRLRGIGIRAEGVKRVIMFERLGNGTLEQRDLAAWLRSCGLRHPPENN